MILQMPDYEIFMHNNTNKSKESEMAFIQANITRVATADEDFIAEIAFKHVSLNFNKKNHRQ